MKSRIGGSFPVMHRGTSTRKKASPLHLLLIYLIAIAFTACAPFPPPDEFRPFDEPPIPMGGIDAIIQNLPAEARESSGDSMALFRAFINSIGEVTDITIIGSLPGLNNAVSEAIMATTWKPAKLMGEAVGVWVIILVEIQIGETRVLYSPYDHPPMPVGGYKAINVKLRYPEIAIEAGVEGLVIVLAFVNEDGEITMVAIQKSVPNTGLDEAAIEAVKNTLFTPAMLNGAAVGAWIAVPLNFRLPF